MEAIQQAYTSFKSLGINTQLGYLSASFMSLALLTSFLQWYNLAFLNYKIDKFYSQQDQGLNLNLPTSISLIDYQPKKHIPMPTYIFHNKMPKCGSTTLNYILKELAVNNNFKYEMILSKEGLKGNAIGTSHRLQDIRQKSSQNNILVMQHQNFINFTEYKIFPQPTFINVVRNPIDKFVSNYYFCRFGSANIPKRGTRCEKMTAREIDMPVQTYVQTVDELSVGDIDYVKWLCGAGLNCMWDNDFEKRKVYEYTKTLIMEHYFIVGVLEKFDMTLDLFDVLLPEYFKGAKNIYHTSSSVKRMIESMRTNHKDPLSNATRAFLEENDFKYRVGLKYSDRAT